MTLSDRGTVRLARGGVRRPRLVQVVGLGARARPAGRSALADPVPAPARAAAGPGPPCWSRPGRSSAEQQTFAWTAGTRRPASRCPASTPGSSAPPRDPTTSASSPTGSSRSRPPSSQALAARSFGRAAVSVATAGPIERLPTGGALALPADSSEPAGARRGARPGSRRSPSVAMRTPAAGCSACPATTALDRPRGAGAPGPAGDASCGRPPPSRCRRARGLGGDRLAGPDRHGAPPPGRGARRGGPADPAPHPRARGRPQPVAPACPPNPLGLAGDAGADAAADPHPAAAA